VERLTIKCASCGREWLAAAPFSVYEQQAVESCPCPHCGAYTLCCHETAVSHRLATAARRADLRLAARDTGRPEPTGRSGIVVPR
jgi:hypothetical protein